MQNNKYSLKVLTTHCGLMGAGRDAWRAAQSTTCKYNLGNKKLNLGFSSFLFFTFPLFSFLFALLWKKKSVQEKKISLGGKGIG